AGLHRVESLRPELAEGVGQVDPPHLQRPRLIRKAGEHVPNGLQSRLYRVESETAEVAEMLLQAVDRPCRVEGESGQLPENREPAVFQHLVHALEAVNDLVDRLAGFLLALGIDLDLNRNLRDVAGFLVDPG